MPNDVRLIRVPGKSWPAGSRRPLYNWQAVYPRVVNAEISPEYAPLDGQQASVPLGHIPQVAETFSYWDTDYGVQNEKGLSIGESTCTAKTVGWPADKPYGYNLVGIEDLSKIALERCDTARCAAQTMGDIAVEYGFYSADSGDPAAPAYSGSSECLVLGDASPGELWIFNVMTGKGNASAIWAAERVPSTHVTAVGNSFTIRKMNLSDPKNFLYSPGVSQLAEEKGWWSPKEETSADIFDFFRAYGYLPTADSRFPGSHVQAQVLDNVLAYYSARRMWRIFNLLSPEEGAKLDRYKGNLPNEKDPLPNSVSAPARSVTLQMVLDMYRDHYEGTEFDLTKGMAAGPYGNPNRGGKTPLTLAGQWERAISMHRTSWSFVLQARPNGKSITWFGWDAPHGTAYLPFYAAATRGAPASYNGPHTMAKFSTDCAWWAFNLVNQYQDLNFGAINKDVQKKSHQIEAEAQRAVADWEQDASHLSQEAALDLLTKKSNAFAQDSVNQWWGLAWSLIAKYRGYVVTYNSTATGEDAFGQEYPVWWLNSPEVGFTTWTAAGPFHGVDLVPGELLQPNLAAQSPGLSYFWLAAISPLLMSACMLTAAYRAGLRTGRQEQLVDTAYVIAP